MASQKRWWRAHACSENSSIGMGAGHAKSGCMRMRACAAGKRGPEVEGRGGSELVAMARRVCDDEAGSDVVRLGTACMPE